MQTLTQQRAGNDALDAGRTVDDAHARRGDAGRVLIVDDDASARLVCAVNLEVEGLHVLEAADELDALEHARRERPDLILTDVNMPRLRGFRLAERLRVDERTRGIPVLFLSGEVGQANEKRPRARCRRVLDKAVRPARARRVRRERTVAARACPSELTATAAA